MRFFLPCAAFASLLGCAADTFVGPGADGGSDSDGGGAACAPTGFCAAQAGSAFCSDFDNESTPSDWLIDTTSGSVTLTQAFATSCPNGLAVSLPLVTTAPVAGSTSHARAGKVITGAASNVIVDLDVYLPANDTTSYVNFFTVRPTGDLPAAISLEHHADAFWFLANMVNTNTKFTGLASPPLTGAWNHMHLVVIFDNGGGGSASLTYQKQDGTPTTVTTNGQTASDNFSTSSVTLEVGMAAPNTTEADFSAYYDNVVVTFN